MTTKHRAKLVHEENYAADVDLIEDNTGWSPYISLEDAYKLDDARDAIRHRDVKSTLRSARIFSGFR